MTKSVSTRRAAKPPLAAEAEPADEEARASRSPAVSRALRILRLLSDSNQPLGVNAIARELDIFPSTCLHILRAMEAQGFVTPHPEDKRWSIGLGLITVARGALERQFPTRLAQIELDQLTGKFNLTSVLVQLDRNDRMVIVAAARPVRPFGAQVEIGRRFPAYISATGRCLAAYGALGRAELREKFDKLRWEDPPKFDEWINQIDKARREGVGEDLGQYVRGFHIYAAPVFENGQMKRALAILGVQAQFRPEQLGAARTHLREAAARLSV